jgi:hypothetical protein
VGLVGEYIERWDRYEKIFMMLVIIGVSGELLADAPFLFCLIICKRCQKLKSRDSEMTLHRQTCVLRLRNKKQRG